MLWIDEHKNSWRAAILAMVILTLIGPWGFDLINVPSEYPCAAPNIRLEGDFCGMPLRGIRSFDLMVRELFYVSAELITGAIGLAEWAHALLPSLPSFLLVLPLFSTLLLILGGDRRRQQVFNIATWGLALGTGLFITLSAGVRLSSLTGYPELFQLQWGLWLHIGLAVLVLTLEILTLATERRPSLG